MMSHGESSWRLALGDFAPSQTASEECFWLYKRIHFEIHCFTLMAQRHAMSNWMNLGDFVFDSLKIMIRTLGCMSVWFFAIWKTVVMFARSQELMTVSSLDIPKSSKYFGPEEKNRNSSSDIFSGCLYGYGDPTVVKLHRIYTSFLNFIWICGSPHLTKSSKYLGLVFLPWSWSIRMPKSDELPTSWNLNHFWILLMVQKSGEKTGPGM